MRQVAAPLVVRSYLIQGPGTFSFASPFPGMRSVARIELVYVLAGTTVRILPDGLGGEQAPADPGSGQALDLEGIIIRGQVTGFLGVDLPVLSHLSVAILGTGIVSMTVAWHQTILEFEKFERIDRERGTSWGENIEAGLMRERMK